MHGEEERGYRCSQLFGYRSRSEKTIDEDNISALKFDPSGGMLALGDAAGRLIVFNAAGGAGGEQEYDYHFEFQSHEREFDTLRSADIGEGISHINWLRPQGTYLKLLTSNSHTIKLWKVFERTHKHLVRSAGEELAMPHLQPEQPFVSVNLRHVFPNRPCRSLNSMWVSGNEELLFATDECSAFMWSMEGSTHPYLIKQLSRNDNSGPEKCQKITCSHLHPHNENMFVFGTNRGQLGFNDSRASLARANTLTFAAHTPDNNFLSDIINKYCSVMFLEGTRNIVTRDLISLKVWDMCNNQVPLLSMPVDEFIKSHLCDIFEADTLDDRFMLSNANGSIVTGNYSNSFHLIDALSGQNMQYQMNYASETCAREVGSTTKRKNQFNCSDKVLCHDYNLVTGQLAASTHNCFFIYSKDKPEHSDA